MYVRTEADATHLKLTCGLGREDFEGPRYQQISAKVFELRDRLQTSGSLDILGSIF